MLRFPASITKMLQSVGMAPEEIPAFQEQIRHDVTSLHMKVYHPRESLPIHSFTARIEVSK